MWYALWVTTGKEEETADLIRRKAEGFRDCWVPMRVERRKTGDSYVDLEKALFPGYVFLETADPEELYFGLRRIPRFTVILKTDDRYTPISEEEERFIRQLSGPDGKCGVSLGVITGGALRVISGPLIGLERYVVKIDRHKRKAWLEMKLLGKMNRFCMGLEVIEKF